MQARNLFNAFTPLFSFQCDKSDFVQRHVVQVPVRFQEVSLVLERAQLVHVQLDKAEEFGERDHEDHVLLMMPRSFRGRERRDPQEELRQAAQAAGGTRIPPSG